MAEMGASDLLRWAGRNGRHLVAGKITPVEFAAGLVDYLAATPGANAHLAAEVVAALPADVYPVLADVVRDILRPEFRKPAWHYGGPVRVTDAEREQESELLTARVRSWAAVLAEQLRGVDLARPDHGAAEYAD